MGVVAGCLNQERGRRESRGRIRPGARHAHVVGVQRPLLEIGEPPVDDMAVVDRWPAGGSADGAPLDWIGERAVGVEEWSTGGLPGSGGRGEGGVARVHIDFQASGRLPRRPGVVSGQPRGASAPCAR